MKKLVLATLLLFGLFQIGYAQITVTGRVTDNQGNPLPQASVMVKGTTTGVATTDDGSFTIQVPNNSSILVISTVGMVDQEVSVGSRRNIVVALENAAGNMEEVVVVAYGGRVKRSSFTGSAAQVDAKAFENRPISNALNALVGAAPGIQTTTPSGAPGSSAGIVLRGFGSYSLSSGPLYVVDGVVYDGGFSNINPNDIETITALKDASTTALYGSRGANGVIMITTKKGARGRQSLQFKAQMGRSNPAIERYTTVDAFQYYPLAWESYRNGLHYGSTAIPFDSAGMIASGLLPRFTSGANAGRQRFRTGNYRDIYQVLGNYNPFNVPTTQIVSPTGVINPNAQLIYADDMSWLDQATRTGTRNEYNLMYNSGSDRADLSASLGYLKEGGWGLRSQMDRFTGRVNVNVTPTTWFRTGLNIFANRTTFDNSATGGIVNPFYFARYAAPIYPVFLHDPNTGEYVLDAVGNKRYDYGNDAGYARPYNSGRHSIAEHLWNKDNDVRDALSARATAEIIATPWLSFSTNVSYDITNNDNTGYENPLVGDGYPSGRFSIDTYKRTSYTLNQLANLNRKFGLHNVDFLLGHENYNYHYTSTSGMRIGQSFDDIYVYSNFGTINSLSSSIAQNRSEGYFSRLMYDYDDKYLFSASLRRDGNSKFPRDIRWADFWSLGLGWRIDKENFFNVNWVDLLKIRASYGVTGNSETGNYPYQAGLSIGYDDDTRPGVIVTSLGSPQLTWETQKPLDIGLDFAFFKQRISGTIGLFDRNSSGLIFSVPQPIQNGGTPGGGFSISQNIGSMNNRGIEAQLTVVPVRQRDFTWDITFNATHYKNKLTKMPLETPALTSSPFKREVGKSIYDFYTRTYYGVDPADGQVLYQGAITWNPANSRLIQNDKGSFDTVTIDHNNAVQSYIGKTSLPDVYGSIVNNLTFKRFDFSFVLTYQLGGWVYDAVYAGLMTTSTAGRAFHTDMLNRWQKPGDITDVPRIDETRTSQYGAASTRWLTDATYLSINNVSLGYRIPSEVLSKIGASQARIFVSAENLKFFTKRTGMNVNGAFSGITDDTYDAARVMNVGLSLNF